MSVFIFKEMQRLFTKKIEIPVISCNISEINHVFLERFVYVPCDLALDKSCVWSDFNLKRNLNLLKMISRLQRTIHC